ncbi:MAG TPA: EAL domain-containing protein [Usitatibacter sp.]|nr:EAL domain-containing protein [Usitatibacter sp.]
MVNLNRAGPRALIDMHDYTPAARAYWWVVAILGTVAIAYSLAAVAMLDAPSIAQVFVLAAIAAVVGLFPVRIPGAKTSFGGAEIFIFLSLLLHGAPAAVLATALEGGVGAFRTSKRATSWIISPALAGLAMLVCGTGFDQARTLVEGHGSNGNALVSMVLLFALVLYAANTFLTSLLFALKKDRRIAPVRWLRDNGWIGLAYVSGAAISGLMYASFQSFGLSFLLISVPVLAMFLTSLHAYFEHKTEDESLVMQLKESESRFHSAFADAALGMCLVAADDGRFVHANKAFGDTLGLTAAETQATTLFALVHQDDHGLLASSIARLKAGDPTVHPEVRGLHREGREVWLSLDISLARDWQLHARNLIVQAQDITLRRVAEAELQHSANHDPLTKLANRVHFDEQLGRAIARMKRHPDRYFAVMYLDLDRFKTINDSLGHKAGDELLVELARRMKGMLRPTDLLARLGGDEFALLLEDMHRGRDAVGLAERLQRELQKPFRLRNMDLSMSASIGITFGSADYASTEQMIRDADTAMYKAKSDGKARYAIFDASLQQHVADQLRLETELRRGLGSGEIQLEYQPIYALRGGRLTGFEALARWHHPERGVLEPSSFIPLAEETGLIIPLGRWVLHEACRQMAEFSRAGGRSLRMSVNISGRQVADPQFAVEVSQAIAETGISPGQLTLEVTESVLMDSQSESVAMLRQLRAMGVALSIDDFGTGHSSLAYLAQLPIDQLKIDRSFIAPLGEGDARGEVVRAIMTLGRALSKQVLAEGIETPKQLSILQDLGCEVGQGFLLSRPLDAKAAVALVAERGASA